MNLRSRCPLRDQPADLGPSDMASTEHIVDGTAPPYYAAILTTVVSDDPTDLHGYDELSERMLDLAHTIDGFLGLEFARSGQGGIAVSYWRDLNALHRWRTHAEHIAVQLIGQQRFYTHYRARICRVEREYSWYRPPEAGRHGRP